MVTGYSENTLVNWVGHRMISQWH